MWQEFLEYAILSLRSNVSAEHETGRRSEASSKSSIGRLRSPTGMRSKPKSAASRQRGKATHWMRPYDLCTGQLSTPDNRASSDDVFPAVHTDHVTGGPLGPGSAEARDRAGHILRSGEPS